MKVETQAFIIAKATANDAEAICNVGRRSFYDAFVHLFNRHYELEEYLDRTYSQSKINESLAKPSNSFFIVYSKEKPVGFAKMKKVASRKVLNASSESELQKIYVLKEYHGSGAGQALMEAVINETKEIRSNVLWLDVHVSNAKAKRFYEKNGFRKTGDHSFVIGTQTFYYDVMALPLNK